MNKIVFVAKINLDYCPALNAFLYSIRAWRTAGFRIIFSDISLLNTRPSRSNTDYRHFVKLWNVNGNLRIPNKTKPEQGQE
jgi:hypothetical protein